MINIPHIRVCTRRCGFFLLANDPISAQFHMTSELYPVRADAEAARTRILANGFDAAEWNRNTRAGQVTS